MTLTYGKTHTYGWPEASSPRGFWRRLERALFWIGVLGLAIWAAAYAHAAFYRSYDDWAFSQSLEGKPVSLRAFIADAAVIEFNQEPSKKPVAEPPAAENSNLLLTEEESPERANWSPERVRAWQRAKSKPMPADGQPFARLEIPRVGLRTMVLPGVSRLTLNRGAGHIPGTAMPWEAGNFGVAGHRDGFFRSLEHIASGDEIILTTIRGKFTYRVSQISIVKPDDVNPLAPTPKQAITLVTCYPFYYVGSAPQRFIVRAEAVEAASLGQ